jgi:tetratricopeptide (TPR) repeat protein
LQPEGPGNYGRLADVYEEMGRYDEALAVHEKEKRVSGRAQDLSPAVARIYARMGKVTRARRILRSATD